MLKKKISKILSVFLITLMMFSYVPLSAFAESSEPQFHLTMTADKDAVNVGDIVTFTVNLKGSETAKSAGWQFKLAIPEGLSYIPDSGQLNPDLKETIGAYDECSFTESSRIMVVVSIHGLKNLNQENEIFTFRCRVDDISSGQFFVGVTDLIIMNNDYNELSESEYLFTGVTLNAQTTSSITGFVSSSGSDEDKTKIELIKDGETEPAYIVSVTDTFIIENVTAGNYTLYVSKKNHATRTYNITVTEDIALDLNIFFIGDATGDGKINTIDVARANAHASGRATLSDYNFDCADVNNDGKVNTIDVALINAHSRGVKSLW